MISTLIVPTGQRTAGSPNISRASFRRMLSDAAHMLTDAGALAMSLVVIRLVARPAAGNLTFGLKRTEILSAQDGASVDHERAFSSVPRGA